MVSLALLLAAAPGASLVPSGARAAVLLDGSSAAAGIAALLSTAGRHAAGLSPADASAWFRNTVGVDLISEQPEWGLSPQGPRALVFLDGGVALSAPVSDAKAARRALDAWSSVREQPKRRRAPRERAGRIVGTGRKARVVLASGGAAADLVAALARVKAPLSSDGALAPALSRPLGPAWIYFRLAEPLRCAVAALDASGNGLVAKGLVMPSKEEPVLAGSAPERCEGAPLLCLRAGLGDSGRALIMAALRDALGRALEASARNLVLGLLSGQPADRVAVRIESVDARLLGGERDSIWAASYGASFAPAAPFALPPALPPSVARTGTGIEVRGSGTLCVDQRGGALALTSPCGPAPEVRPGEGPALDLSFDTGAFDGELSRLSPVDVLHGPVAASAYATHLLYGRLLRNAGPLTVVGSPARDLPAAAEIELRLPVR